MPDFLRIFRKCVFCNRRTHISLSERLRHVGPPYISYHHSCLLRAMQTQTQEIPQGLRTIAHEITQLVLGQQQQNLQHVEELRRQSDVQQEMQTTQEIETRYDQIRLALEEAGESRLAQNLAHFTNYADDYTWNMTTVTTSPVGIGTTPTFRIDIKKTPINSKQQENNELPKKIDKQNKMKKIFGDDNA